MAAGQRQYQFRAADPSAPESAPARQQELTPRQQQVLTLYYDQGMNMTQIAQTLGVNCSTVSRTIRRANQRLYRCLRYCL